MTSINKGRQLMCCLECGRDTRATTGICQHCYGRLDRREERGRHARDLKTLEGDPNDDLDVDDSLSDYRYHGSHLE